MWDVRPPQFALGRRARAAALPQASQPAVPAPVRAPSPLLPRIASARNQHHAKGGERQRPLQAVEARLAMLEERMSNVDRENAFLRHTVDTLQARMSTELDAAKAVRLSVLFFVTERATSHLFVLCDTLCCVPFPMAHAWCCCVSAHAQRHARPSANGCACAVNRRHDGQGSQARCATGESDAKGWCCLAPRRGSAPCWASPRLATGCGRGRG